MAKTPSKMIALGTNAPDFALPDFNGKIISKKDYSGKPLLVMFICNHCPYVKHVRSMLAKIGQHPKVSVVAINSNDMDEYPEDNIENMRIEAKEAGYTFPYLADEKQSVAHAYHAACTPDFFLFNEKHQLVYRGQLDSSRPGNSIPVSGEDLLTAMNALAEGKPIATEQKPSLGCNIKWKPGNEPTP